MWTFARDVQPEELDELAPDDPRAVRARHDLARVNALIFQSAIMARALRKATGNQPPRTMLDLGGGDGRAMLAVARRLGPAWRGVELTVLDRHAIVSPLTRQQFEALGWSVRTAAADVFKYLASADTPEVDLTTANLFLHHFQPEPLTRLLAGAAACTRHAFVACEPRRGWPGLLASRMLWAVGCGAVTRNDAEISVRAGFSGRELSAAWPDPAGWDLNEHPVLLTQRLLARRRSG